MRAGALIIGTLLMAICLVSGSVAAADPGARYAAAIAPSVGSAPKAGIGPGTVIPSRPEPWARFNRFAFSFGFGFGSVSLGRVHDMVDDLAAAAANLRIEEAPKSGLQINAEAAFRYYFPYYILAQVGYSTLYNKATGSGQVNSTIGWLDTKAYSHNLVMEVPILVGGYYAFIERLYVFAAAGPSVFFFPRSFWDLEPGGLPDFKADTGVGAQVLTGADFLLAEHFAVGLELRYRYLKTGEIRDTELGLTATDAAGKTYNLDFSGISLSLLLRFYIT
jgi:opacity protein-like surface antigen